MTDADLIAGAKAMEYSKKKVDREKDLVLPPTFTRIWIIGICVLFYQLFDTVIFIVRTTKIEDYANFMSKAIFRRDY